MLHKHIAVAILVSSGFPCLSQTPARTGAIRGTVVDINGEPVAGVAVTIFEVGMPTPPSLHRLTDSTGRFFQGGLGWGRFYIFTDKHADGYAFSYVKIYSGTEPTIVEVSANAPLAEITMRLGPKCAVLAGSITDAVTGKPVLQPGIRIWKWTDGIDKDSEYVAAAVDASYELLIPPDKEVGVEFSAPGYESWQYRAEWDGTRPSPLFLPSNTRKTLDVKLRPLPK